MINTSHELGVMSQEKTIIKTFTDLFAWQMAHKLAIKIYEATKNFPSSEQFGLTNQIRRAAVSVTSNIAEGFGRRTAADRLHFYDMSRASLSEAQSQTYLARDVKYLDEVNFSELIEMSTTVHKLLTGLINKTRGV